MSDNRSELKELRAALAAVEGRAASAEADLARARAVVSTSEAMIVGLEVALLKRDKYGRSAERSAKLLDQLELQLEELVADAAEDRVQAERKTTRVGAFMRRKPVKKAFPEHLPRERVVVEAPAHVHAADPIAS